MYFKNVKTLEELKREYHKLAVKYHPDREGGDLETMQKINAEYDKVFKRVKNNFYTKDREIYNKDNEEGINDFRDLINNLILLDNITIEIIGTFIWVSGDTLKHKEKLKELGLRWSGKKQMWYKSPKGYRRHGKGEYSMEHIKSIYSTRYSHTTSDSNKQIQKA